MFVGEKRNLRSFKYSFNDSKLFIIDVMVFQEQIYLLDNDHLVFEQ